MTRINVGCGPAALPGFDNIDNSPSVFLARHPALKWLVFRLGLMSARQYETKWPADILWQDASRGLRYADGEVDRIYSSHFLEHLREDVAVRVLKECRRVLKPGGLFRLVVPDLLHFARKYVAETEALIEKDTASRAARDELLFTVCGGHLKKDRAGSLHMFMYDWPALRLLLTEVGFSDIRRCAFQQSADPELAKLDNRPEDSLLVEMTVR
jgi:SAM-dependent methyltransferase